MINWSLCYDSPEDDAADGGPRTSSSRLASREACQAGVIVIVI